MGARVTWAAGIAAIVLAATPAAAPPVPAAAPQAAPAKMPEAETLIILIRSSLLAVHHGNVTGNYTVLRDLAAPGFQAANSAARLGAIFANLRDQGVDLSVAALLTPQITQGPTITPQGMLGLAGVIPAQPLQLQFQLVFQPVDNRWRLFGVSVTTAPAPGAPAPVAAAPAKPATEAGARPAAPAPPRR